MKAPLAGVRVLDLTRLLPGNYCAWLLAALGAEVIKVEDPGAGDYMRTFGVQVGGQGAAHHIVNRAKRSVVVDLKSEQGREVFLQLVDTADAVVESFRPGVWTGSVSDRKCCEAVGRPWWSPRSAASARAGRFAGWWPTISMHLPSRGSSSSLMDLAGFRQP